MAKERDYVGMETSTHDTSDRHLQPVSRELIQIARYLSGECDADEATQIRARLAADSERRQAAEQGQRLWDRASEPSMQWDTDRVWQMVQRRRGAEGGIQKTRVVSSYSKRLYAGVVSAAASILVIAGVVLLNRGDSSQSAAKEGSSSEPGRVFVTQRGQRSIVQLPDGTEMILAAESRLHVPDSYGRTNRDVYLEGTAQFTVRHNATKPFVVHTQLGETRDLATRFVVAAYPSDSVERVVVTEGRVMTNTRMYTSRMSDRGGVSTNAPSTHVKELSAMDARNTALRASLVLNPGDIGTLNRDGSMHVQHDSDVDAYIAWVRGELRFSNASLEQVAMELERWYDVRVEVVGSHLSRERVTASMGRGTIDDALQVISAILDVQVARNGSHIRIFKENVR